MVATIPFNPYVTVGAPGTFNIQTDGYIQGMAMPDPSARYRLASGVLASTETLPMWGGVGISETTSPYSGGQSQGVAGGKITRATTISSTGAAGALTGFSVFDQAYNFVTTPQSPVPLIGSYGTLNFYRFGSRARVPLAIDPALVDLEGNPISQQVSWDFSLQRLIPYVAAYAANVFTALTRALTGGVYVATATTTTAHGVAVGDDFTVSGCVPAAYNGTWTAITGTTGSTLVWSLGTATDPGAETTLGQLDAGGGAVPVEILNVNIGNSMTVSYDTVTGFASWNRAGSTALVQL